MILCVVDYLGYYGPVILPVVTMLVLRMRTKLILLYLCFLVINTVTNVILKLLIRESRPTGQVFLTRFEHETDSHTYGMPSGHAQSVAYTSTFLYTLSQSANVMFVVGVIGWSTLYQRYKYRRHSVRQLVACVAIGSLIAMLGKSVHIKY